jgi:hypothetical protein
MANPSRVADCDTDGLDRSQPKTPAWLFIEEKLLRDESIDYKCKYMSCIDI